MNEGQGQGEKAPKELRFEEAYARLESVVRRLETGEAELDESLRLFEEGVKLARTCTVLLDKAQAKIRLLTTDETGHPQETEAQLDLPGAVSS